MDKPGISILKTAHNATINRKKTAVSPKTHDVKPAC
jgi:hypothetical protein